MKKRTNIRKTISIVITSFVIACIAWTWIYSTNLTRVCSWGQKPIFMICRETNTGGYHCDGLGYTVDSIKYTKGKGFNDYYQLGGWNQIRLFGKLTLESGG